MFLSLHQLVTRYEILDFCFYFFVVAMQKEAHSSFIELRHQYIKKVNKEVFGFWSLADATKETLEYMFSLEFFQTSKMCFKYENVPYVEYEIQRRVLTGNVDKRPSTANICIYSGHIIHIRVHIKVGERMSPKQLLTFADASHRFPKDWEFIPKI